MDEIVFTIPGPIVGKQRPRFAKHGAFTRAYTPAKTTNYENLVKLSYSEIVAQKFGDDSELYVEIIAFYEIPKSTSKKKAERMKNGELRPTKKPDADNIAKIILDALNGVAFKDDAQVVKLTVMKLYGDPRAIVRIMEI